MMRLGLLFAFSVPALFATTLPTVNAGVPVTTVVTVQAKGGAIPAPLNRDDVSVFRNNQRLPVTETEPVRNLQLWVLIDDGAAKNITLQFPELRSFIRQQSPSAEIGIGYMRNGTVQVAQALTTDHERAAAALRIPMGPAGIAASPYIALSDLIKKHWPAGQTREVLMITSGIDPDYGAGPEDPYLLNAIADAQRAGVIVHSVYYRTSGRSGFSGIYWGQNNMSELSDDTAGAFYWEGTLNPVTIGPYLTDLNRRLSAQYLVTFLASPGDRARLEHFKVSTDLPNVKVVAPALIPVPAL